MFVSASSRRVRALANTVIAVSAVSIAVLGGASVVHAEPAAGAVDRDEKAPVVRRSNAPGVGEIVEVPRRMHHTLRATVDERGDVKLEGKRGAAPAQPAAKAE